MERNKIYTSQRQQLGSVQGTNATWNFLEECETDLQMKVTVTSLLYDQSHSLNLIDFHVRTLHLNIA